MIYIKKSQKMPILAVNLCPVDTDSNIPAGITFAKRILGGYAGER
jgi:hypothetical protein